MINKFENYRIILIILLLGTVLRFLWIVYNSDYLPVSDANFYYETAKSLSQGYGYAHDGKLTARWPVGWPAFLSLAFRVFGPHVFVGQLLQLILSILVLILTYLIAQKQFCNKKISLLAVTIMAFFPNQIVYPATLFSDILLQFVFLLLVYLTIFIMNDIEIRGIKGNKFFSTIVISSLLLYVLVGIVFGLSLYVKPILIGFPIIYIVAFSFYNKLEFKHYIVSLLVIYFVGIVLHIPWVYRNYKLYNDLVFVSTNGGVNLHIGNNPNSTGNYNDDYAPKNDPVYSNLTTVTQRDKYYRKLALSYIYHYPEDFVKNFVKKTYYLWYSDADGYSWSIMSNNKRYLYNPDFTNSEKLVKILFQIYYIVILTSCTLAILIVNRRYICLYISILYFILIYGIFFGSPRFHFPLIPIISILSAYSIFNYKKFFQWRTIKMKE